MAATDVLLEGELTELPSLIYSEPVRQPKITSAFAARRDRLAVTFPAARDFLVALEEPPLWLSTATNAHLYSDRRNLAYIRVKAPDVQPPSLLLSPRFNNRIVTGTHDASALLFPRLVNELIGEQGDWWHRRPGGAVELRSSTPPLFFGDLLAAVRAL